MSAENNPFEQEHKDEPTSRTMGRGAFLKLLAGGAAGSLLVPKGALAAADALASMERAKPLVAPPGVEIIYDAHQQDIESAQASAMATHRWRGGGLVLGPGKTMNNVDITRSPSAYGQMDPAHFPEFNKADDKYGGDYITFIEPFIVNFPVKLNSGGHQERTFLMAFNYDDGYDRWNYLDLAWARANGALEALAIKGQKPHLVKERPDGPADLPTFNLIPSGSDYGEWAGTFIYSNALEQERDIKTVPSKALPPILTKV